MTRRSAEKPTVPPHMPAEPRSSVPMPTGPASSSTTTLPLPVPVDNSNLRDRQGSQVEAMPRSIAKTAGAGISFLPQDALQNHHRLAKQSQANEQNTGQR